MTSTLERPVAARRALSAVGPNWFATVMGTGIVATAAVSLPHQVPGLHGFAVGVWLLTSALLVAVLTATGLHWLRHPGAARAHLRDPVVGNFYGAVPMALLTVGAGTLLLGRDVIGRPAALAVAWTLWVVGTALGLACAVVVPRSASTGAPFGGWLMPVVPPMVSAASGALLAAHLAVGRQPMLAFCYGLFAYALAASGVVLRRLGRQVLTHGLGPVALVPTLWIVLGPLGQSITAANGLATAAAGTSFAGVAAAFGLGYGLVAWGVAVGWLAVALVLTLRARPPFGLPWWSFTFPVGTVVTGTSALAARTGWSALGWIAVGLYGGLVAAWLVVGTLTARNARRLMA